MRSKLATLALAGALGLTGVAGAALVVPAVSYAATGDSTALTERVSSIKQALAGLVTDGTLTQAQADEVATALAEARPERGGPGGGHHAGHVGVDAAAEALGMTEAEVLSALRSGQTLADLAEENGVAQSALVDALVAAAQERLTQAVTDGRLTQAEADERAATLEERIAASLDEVRSPGRGGGRGHGGHGEGSPRSEPEIRGSSTSL